VKRPSSARCRFLEAAVLALGALVGAGHADELNLVWVGDTEATGGIPSHVEVRGLNRSQVDAVAQGGGAGRKWDAFLTVRVDQGADVQAALVTPPMAGNYQWANGVLRFQPAFSFEAGLTYRAVFRDPSDGGAAPLVASQRMPSIAKERTTEVAEVYPTADVLPANLLKFYLQFSAPMSRGRIYDHVHLIDEASGNEVEIPFLEIDEELWDPPMKRVTLFIDPGRIKRGVKPLEEVGPSLQEGRRYRLEIDEAWLDGRGVPLRSGFQKRFAVVETDRQAPRVEAWEWESRPSAGTQEPLVVRFGEPLDHALAHRLIRVIDARGKRVSGTASVEEKEQGWRFVPETAWPKGEFRVRASSVLEDLAGNQLGKVFEVDLFEEIDDQARPKSRWFDRGVRLD
jgi:hypothetical protein